MDLGLKSRHMLQSLLREVLSKVWNGNTPILCSITANYKADTARTWSTCPQYYEVVLQHYAVTLARYIIPSTCMWPFDNQYIIVWLSNCPTCVPVELGAWLVTGDWGIQLHKTHLTIYSLVTYNGNILSCCETAIIRFWQRIVWQNIMLP